MISRYHKYFGIHIFSQNINLIGRVDKYSLLVLHNNKFYINCNYLLNMIYINNNIHMDLKYIYFQLKLIHHLNLMMQTLDFHELKMEFKMQNQEF
ncbi:unnamed protein product [Paramecium pentaurelia]|uniref:Uncharacterized protein n=1 Tax=Paramecium pentaurelia TaxID=43138 RepID=A0A8S1WMX5_9CILI|nr:unnamed protein product [Paramecium pentaurelia]